MERSQDSFEALVQPSGNAGERHNALFPRTGSPPIASLPALQVRHDDDVQDAEDYACGEQGEFDGHLRGYTNSVTPWSAHDPIPKARFGSHQMPGTSRHRTRAV